MKLNKELIDKIIENAVFSDELVYLERSGTEYNGEDFSLTKMYFDDGSNDSSIVFDLSVSIENEKYVIRCDGIIENLLELENKINNGEI